MGETADSTNLSAADPRLDQATLTGLTALGLGPRPLAMLSDMVAAQLGRPRAHVCTAQVHVHTYDRLALTTAGRYQVCGTAGDGTGRTHDYAFFVKLVQAWSRSPLFQEVPELLRSHLAPLMPWRTEPDIYRGDLRRCLPSGISIPRAYHVADLDEQSAAIWLDCVAVQSLRWDVERYRHAAYLLGRLAASRSVAPFAADVPVGRTARRFAEHWLAVNIVPALSEDGFWRRPCVAATFDDRLRRRIERAAAALPALVDELESFPTMTAHGDACSDNLLRTERNPDLVLIDFGFWGTAPIGFDLGQLLLGDIQLGRRSADTFPELEQTCLPAYTQGLRDEGCTVPIHQVRRAHAVAMTIFHAIPAVPYEHRAADADEGLRSLFANRAEMARHLLDLLAATEKGNQHEPGDS